MKLDSKIIITGVNGLVGSHLLEYLERKGYENVVGLGRSECDLMIASDVADFFATERPDYVFHLAGRVHGIMGNMLNQGPSIFENLIINTNIIEKCRLFNVKKLVAMGTGAVYPFPSPGLPLQEDMIFSGRPHSAEASYAQAKRTMLAMLEAYQCSYGLVWAFVVSCNLFGPNDKFDPVNGHVVPALISKFFDAKQSNSNVSVWGDGSAQRDFMYVKDTAHALHLIMKGCEGAVNMGTGNVVSIKKIVDEVAAISGMQDKVEWDSSMPNGQDYRAYDLSKLSETGFRSSYSISAGLQQTWEWYCENIRLDKVRR